MGFGLVEGFEFRTLYMCSLKRRRLTMFQMFSLSFFSSLLFKFEVFFWHKCFLSGKFLAASLGRQPSFTWRNLLEGGNLLSIGF